MSVIKVLEEIRICGERTKYKCLCYCGKEFIALAYNINNGHTKSCGCNKGKRLTTNTYVGKYKDKVESLGYTLLSEYSGYKTLHDFHCSLCKTIFKQSFNNMFAGFIGCNCSKRPKRVVKQDVVSCLTEIQEKSNTLFEVLEYAGNQTKIKVKPSCGCCTEYESTFTNVKNANDLTFCRNNSLDLIVSKLKHNIMICLDYENSPVMKRKIKCKCLIHNELFESSLTDIFFNYRGCKVCKSETRSLSQRLTPTEAENNLKSRHGDTYSFVIPDDFTTENSSILIRCPKGHDFYRSYTKAYRPIIGIKCPICNSNRSLKSRNYKLYLLLVKGFGDIFLKIGITSVSVNSRVSDILKNSIYDADILYQVNINDSTTAKKIERHIKNNYARYKVSKKDMPDGYTEALTLINYDDIINYIEESLNHCTSDYNIVRNIDVRSLNIIPELGGWNDM
jgi:hypothetical protein